MSGGSLQYMYMRIAELAELVREETDVPLHLAFADHLDLCATAAHDIEWVLSGDTRPGSEVDAIRQVLGLRAEVDGRRWR